MNYLCSCSNQISFDVTGIAAFALRVKCKQCGEWLSLTDTARTLVGVAAGAKEELSMMVAVAAADGRISNEEASLLHSAAQAMGVDVNVLEELMTKLPNHESSTLPRPATAYPNREEFKEERGSYDWQGFALHAKDVAAGDPVLKRYRDDIVHMLSHNADHAKDRARYWNDCYDRSADATEWDELLENRQRALDLAASLRQLRNDIQSASRDEFATVIAAVALNSSAESW